MLKVNTMTSIPMLFLIFSDVHTSFRKTSTILYVPKKILLVYTILLTFCLLFLCWTDLYTVCIYFISIWLYVIANGLLCPHHHFYLVPCSAGWCIQLKEINKSGARCPFTAELWTIVVPIKRICYAVFNFIHIKLTNVQWTNYSILYLLNYEQTIYCRAIQP
jgi:hypothetical protein